MSEPRHRSGRTRDSAAWRCHNCACAMMRTVAAIAPKPFACRIDAIRHRPRSDGGRCPSVREQSKGATGTAAGPGHVHFPAGFRGSTGASVTSPSAAAAGRTGEVHDAAAIIPPHRNADLWMPDMAGARATGSCGLRSSSACPCGAPGADAGAGSRYEPDPEKVRAIAFPANGAVGLVAGGEALPDAARRSIPRRAELAALAAAMRGLCPGRPFIGLLRRRWRHGPSSFAGDFDAGAVFSRPGARRDDT